MVSRPVGMRHVNLSLAPTQWPSLVGETTMKIRFFAQDTSLLGRFAQERELCAMAREAGPTKLADCKLRRPLAYYKSSNCAGVQVGGPIYFTGQRTARARRGGVARRRPLTSATHWWRSSFKVKLSRWRRTLLERRWMCRMRWRWIGTLRRGGRVYEMACHRRN